MLKISVITIVYNNQANIAGCIQSVLNQSYQNIEHIVIDGGSTDGTRAAIEPFKDKLGYYLSEKDKGLYNALNKGIRAATGDIIGILHSDDFYYDNDTLKAVADCFEQTKADLVYANGQYVLQSTNYKLQTTDYKIKRIYRAHPFRKCYLNLGWIPLHTTIYVRKEVFENYGLYDESYSIASDYEISQRWFREDKIKKAFLNRWVVKMRLGGKSTNPALQKKKSAEDMRVIRAYKMWGYFTLACKIGQKIPQYLLPQLTFYRRKTFKRYRP